MTDVGSFVLLDAGTIGTLQDSPSSRKSLVIHSLAIGKALQ
jgi:hypothetical protein